MEVLNHAARTHMDVVKHRFMRLLQRLKQPLRSLSLCALAALLVGGITLTASAQTPEYQLKAVFLFNFTQFVEWPSAAFSSPNSPIVIGVLGADPFGSYLDETVRGETVNGRPLIVQRYTKIEEVDTCHVLFVSRSETARVQHILARLRGRSILSVSDIDGFATQGGVIRFLTVSNKVRLRINLEAARLANLTISSKLLRPADIVGAGEG